MKARFNNICDKVVIENDEGKIALDGDELAELHEWLKSNDPEGEW